MRQGKSEKANSELMRQQNRRIVLEMLRNVGPMARIELGRRTGLSPATISSIAAQLIKQGQVHALDEISDPDVQQRRGRPLTRLGLNPAATQVLAVKISVDGVELALADFRGDILRRVKLDIAGYEASAERFGLSVAHEIKAFLLTSHAAVARIGVAIQGVVDTASGSVAWSPAFRARNIPIAAPIERVVGIACSVANDANMIAEGLISLDRERYSGNTAVIFMGYGVGMGLILNGAVYHGGTGAAAEFGHMNHLPDGPMCRCGRRGCIEAYAADYGIKRAAEVTPELTRPAVSAVPAATMIALEEAARDGEPRAMAAFAGAGEALGYGIARLIAILSPDRIVLAGPGTRAIALISPALHQAIEDGVVDALRRKVEIDVVPIDTDMIIKGTIDSMLRALDADIFSAGTISNGGTQIKRYS